MKIYSINKLNLIILLFKLHSIISNSLMIVSHLKSYKQIQYFSSIIVLLNSVPQQFYNLTTITNYLPMINYHSFLPQHDIQNKEVHLIYYYYWKFYAFFFQTNNKFLAIRYLMAYQSIPYKQNYI